MGCCLLNFKSGGWIMSNTDQKAETEVNRQEIKDFLLLLNSIGQCKILSTKKDAKNFYFCWLNLVERLIKFYGYKDLNFILDSLRNVWSSNVDFISVVYVFENSESSRVFFIARLEEVAEEMALYRFTPQQFLQHSHLL